MVVARSFLPSMDWRAYCILRAQGQEPEDSRTYANLRGGLDFRWSHFVSRGGFCVVLCDFDCYRYYRYYCYYFCHYCVSVRGIPTPSKSLTLSERKERSGEVIVLINRLLLESCTQVTTDL